MGLATVCTYQEAVHFWQDWYSDLKHAGESKDGKLDDTVQLVRDKLDEMDKTLHEIQRVREG